MTVTTQRTSNHRRKGWVVIGAALILGLFAFPATAMAKDDKPPKVVVCDAHHGEYRIKLVSDDKVEKRLDKHDEDGVPGGAVPGMDGYVFDDACVPVWACTVPAQLRVVPQPRGQAPYVVSSDVAGIIFEGFGWTSISPTLLPGEFTAAGGAYSGTVHIECGGVVTFNVRTGVTS
jgi:hypothetical protein